MLDVGIYCFAVDVDLLDGPGVDVRLDFSFDRLEHDLESGDLDTAAGGACAGADDHEAEENESGYARPHVKVGGSKTCCRDDG